MNQSNQSKVLEFSRAFGAFVGARPELPVTEVRSLRIELLSEEFGEYLAAEGAADLVEVADALADLLYIAYGTAIAYGFDLDAVFAEVHRSNMEKLGPDGRPIVRDDGKVLKPDGWEPPRISDVIFRGVACQK